MSTPLPATITSSTSRRHFHTFDALRFFACLKVFIQHLPIFAFPWFSVLKNGGAIGVQFFFVLSGFLITYIICEEKLHSGSLNLKDFFARRILRIWPLYYLVLVIAYAIPYISAHFLHVSLLAPGYKPQWWVSALFLENYKMMFSRQDPNISVLGVMWSLCIEEHFYIVWGVLLYFNPVKIVPRLIAACLVAAPFIRALYEYNNIITSDLFSNMDLFAFGAIPAYLYAVKPVQTEAHINRIPVIYKRLFVVILLVAVTGFSQVTRYAQYMFITTTLGALFSLLLFFTLPANTRFRINDRNVLSRLGVYTYGFYMYHTLVISITRKIFGYKGWELENGKWALAFAIVTFVLSVACSIMSYHFFEKYFLKLKKYFKGEKVKLAVDNNKGGYNNVNTN